MSAKTVSRGSGSAKARSEYIDREGKYKKDCDEVLYKASGNMPDWANNNSQYWEAADTYERGNGRLFKQLEFSLPKELKAEEQKELVQAYVDKLTTTKDGNLPYSYAIHKGHDSENPHCHLMISERAQDEYNRTPETWFRRATGQNPELGGAKKSEVMKPKEWLEEARQEWSRQANKSLEKAGYEDRIDHRSLKDQGVDREPTRHRGPALNAMITSGKLKPNEIEKDISEPNDNRKKESELAAAISLKQSIAQGVDKARQKFIKEKECLAAEKIRLENLKEQTLEKQRQEKKAQQKNRGMGR